MADRQAQAEGSTNAQEVQTVHIHNYLLSTIYYNNERVLGTAMERDK